MARNKSATRADAPVAEVQIKVDRTLARAWKKVRAVIEASSIEGMRAWDRKYEAVGQVLAHEPPLYLAGGVSTAAGFFEKYLPGVSRPPS